MSKQEKIAVTFTKHWRGYNPGETACFDAALSARLVDGKVAEKASGASAAAGSQSGARSRKSDSGEKAGKTTTVAEPLETSGPAASNDGAGGTGGVDDPRP